MKYFITLFMLMFCVNFGFCDDTTSSFYTDDENKLIAYHNDEANSAMHQDDTKTTSLVTTDFKATFIRMMITLAVIVALIFITFWMFRRMMRHRMKTTTNTKAIQILEKKALSPKSMLYLVEVEGEKVLVSESHIEVRSLHELYEKEEEIEEK